MKQENLVTCPNCKHQFNIETALTADLEKDIDARLRKELNEKYADERKKLQDAIKEKEHEMEKEKKAWSEQQIKELADKKKEIEEQVKKKLSLDNEALLESLKKTNNEQEEKIRNLRKLEVEKLELEKRMKDLAENNEIQTRKLLIEKENELKEKLGKEAEQKSELKTKELEKQLEDQKKLIEEMRRKSEQGSMQLQGEVQELAMEELLKHTFPLDKISEVGKGVRGADLIQTVVNSFGQECGKIVWESKRTKEFQPLWIEKFKTDFRSSGGDIGVIVTQAMPKDMEGFGLKEGIYICNYQEAKSLAIILHSTLERIHERVASNENKGEKMQMLYDYLTGNEFKNQMEAITEGFFSMKKAIISEKISMEKIWKEREKQIDKVLLNAAGMFGNVKGIAGSAVAEIKGLELGNQENGQNFNP